MDNGTAPFDNLTIDFGEDPGFIAYNVTMLVVILLPAAVVDVFLLVALVLDKSTPVQIRTVIINLLLGALCVAFSLSLNHLTSLVLSISNVQLPPNGFCHVLIWVVAGAGGVRMIFTAVFSIVVFILIKDSAKAVKEGVLIVFCIVLWIFAFVLSAPLLSPVVVGSQFLGGAACFPKNTDEAIGTAVSGAYVALWAVVLGLVPFAVTFTMPIIASVYLHRSTVSNNMRFKKAMMKFGLFLIVVVAFNFVGQVLPPLLAFVLVELSTQSPFVYYLGLTIMGVSLVPTPILTLVYLEGVRRKAMEMCLCYCVRFRDDMSRADHVSRASFLQKRQDTRSIRVTT